MNMQFWGHVCVYIYIDSSSFIDDTTVWISVSTKGYTWPEIVDSSQLLFSSLTFTVADNLNPLFKQLLHIPEFCIPDCKGNRDIRRGVSVHQKNSVCLPPLQFHILPTGMHNGVWCPRALWGNYAGGPHLLDWTWDSTGWPCRFCTLCHFIIQ